MVMPPIETERLLLRPFLPEDLDAIFQILDVAPGDVDLDDPAAVAEAKAGRQAWLAWSILNYDALARLHQPPYGDRAVVLRASGELIGAVGLAPALLPFTQLPGLRPPDAAPDWLAPNTSEMGLYWEIAADHRRQGYASEAGAALIRYAFDVLNLQRIVATTTYDNTASIGVMRRLGMTIERNPLPEPIFMQVVGVLENR
ncbi:MAG: GNAT family N-acetyltransferase [Caldilinea sp.]|nr:GNAT family N-acetyltransferase [Caldilineaceae bacterium]MCO5208106.1 GNAT family N-acetyltransferase [Caldilinea sp.]MCB9116237.1 GNAT family N-acetyltransferase [Caldilineaceae bacterium]MCB9121469.1 GNAT family N-acetyltransferase [Caldilineaceae bacterium]MCB9123782.1 GNAT family N-acetyltransferase [Caldilineaceae bacterium]